MMTSSSLSRFLARHQIMLSVGAMVVLGLGALLILAFQFKTVEAQLAVFPDSVREMNLEGVGSPDSSSGVATDASLKTSVRSMFHLAIVLGVALIAFGLLAAWRLVYTVTVPLRRLSEGAATLGGGQSGASN